MPEDVDISINYHREEYIRPWEVVVRKVEASGRITRFNEFFETEEAAREFAAAHREPQEEG